MRESKNVIWRRWTKNACICAFVIGLFCGMIIKMEMLGGLS